MRWVSNWDLYTKNASPINSSASQHTTHQSEMRNFVYSHIKQSYFSTFISRQELHRHCSKIAYQENETQYDVTSRKADTDDCYGNEVGSRTLERSLVQSNTGGESTADERGLGLNSIWWFLPDMDVGCLKTDLDIEIGNPLTSDCYSSTSNTIIFCLITSGSSDFQDKSELLHAEAKNERYSDSRFQVIGGDCFRNCKTHLWHNKIYSIISLGSYEWGKLLPKLLSIFRDPNC